MFFRFACLLALAPVIAGCATNPTRVADGDSVLAKLGAENKGIILIHTALHDSGCANVEAKVAHPDADGRYVAGGERISLKRILNLPKQPSEVVLPAGDYGIVSLECSTGNIHRNFFARATKSGNILTGEGAMFEQPVAKFSLRAGEFVNVGSLQLSTRRTGKIFGPQSEFSTYVIPIDGDVLQKLAAAKPLLYSQLVQRLMTTSGAMNQPEANPVAPNQIQRAPNGNG
jgi:hypothetical protein